MTAVPQRTALSHSLGALAATLVGITCATLGAYVVLRRMAFIGDALAHTVLPGLVTAYLAGWSLVAGSKPASAGVVPLNQSPAPPTKSSTITATDPTTNTSVVSFSILGLALPLG